MLLCTIMRRSNKDFVFFVENYCAALRSSVFRKQRGLMLLIQFCCFMCCKIVNTSLRGDGLIFSFFEIKKQQCSEYLCLMNKAPLYLAKH